MTDPKKKGKYIGLLGAVLVHVAFIIFLFLMGFTLRAAGRERRARDAGRCAPGIGMV